MYNRVVDFMMDKMAENLSENQINMVVATHNEAGALHAANKMLRLSMVFTVHHKLCSFSFQLWHPPGLWACRVRADLRHG